MPDSKPHSVQELAERVARGLRWVPEHSLDFIEGETVHIRADSREALDGLIEQFESLQDDFRAFVNEISQPSFDDSRIEWVEVQIDREALAEARAQVASFPASRGD